MVNPTPLILIPGVLCSARLFMPQVVALWPSGPVTVADHRRDRTMTAIAERILADAPARFALGGLSMGGYLAFEIMRLAPERVTRLALLDTSARPDTPEQTQARQKLIAWAKAGKLDDVIATLAPRFLNAAHQANAAMVRTVKEMAEDTGAEAFVRQQEAVIARVDSRPILPAIKCPTLVLVGDGDIVTPPEMSQEMASAIPGARFVTVRDCGHLATIEQPAAVNAAMSEWRTL
ncbi:MAG: alpha/beta fold hydrolase [Pseudolabrys sp.]